MSKKNKDDGVVDDDDDQNDDDDDGRARDDNDDERNDEALMGLRGVLFPGRVGQSPQDLISVKGDRNNPDV